MLLRSDWRLQGDELEAVKVADGSASADQARVLNAGKLTSKVERLDSRGPRSAVPDPLQSLTGIDSTP